MLYRNNNNSIADFENIGKGKQQTTQQAEYPYA